MASRAVESPQTELLPRPLAQMLPRRRLTSVEARGGRSLKLLLREAAPAARRRRGGVEAPVMEAAETPAVAAAEEARCGGLALRLRLRPKRLRGCRSRGEAAAPEAARRGSSSRSAEACSEAAPVEAAEARRRVARGEAAAPPPTPEAARRRGAGADARA